MENAAGRVLELLRNGAEDEESGGVGVGRDPGRWADAVARVTAEPLNALKWRALVEPVRADVMVALVLPDFPLERLEAGDERVIADLAALLALRLRASRRPGKLRFAAYYRYGSDGGRSASLQILVQSEPETCPETAAAVARRDMGFVVH